VALAELSSQHGACAICGYWDPDQWRVAAHILGHRRTVLREESQPSGEEEKPA
jgi:hypothetical protein